MTKVRRFGLQFLLILRKSSQIFQGRTYQVIAIIGTIFLFCLYVFLPILLVPGNTLRLELEIISPFNYVLLFILALATSFLITLEIFSFLHSRAQGLRIIGEGGTSIFASLVEGVLAAASCGCGTGILLGAIGLGGSTIFVSVNQIPITISLLSIVIVGLYFSARRAANLCDSCTI